ncbi:MAG: DUF547 domain-containing protein [Chitinispirillaceae bacterium]
MLKKENLSLAGEFLNCPTAPLGEERVRQFIIKFCFANSLPYTVDRMSNVVVQVGSVLMEPILRISTRAGIGGMKKTGLSVRAIRKIVCCGLFVLSLPAILLASDPDYDSYRIVLNSYVNSRGLVDYYMLHLDRGPLDRFVHSLEDVKKTDYERWDKRKRVAFLINAYNACVLQVITDNYPVRPGVLFSFLYPVNSIKQIPDVFGRKQFLVMGEKRSLDQIERMLEMESGEPRIYFALVKASLGSPPLRQEIYSEMRLEYQLEDQIRNFTYSHSHYRMDPADKIVYVSAILDKVSSKLKAYGGSREQRVLLFLSPYLSDFDRDLFLNEGYRIRFFRHDWRLNCWS